MHEWIWPNWLETSDVIVRPRQLISRAASTLSSTPAHLSLYLNKSGSSTIYLPNRGLPMWFIYQITVSKHLYLVNQGLPVAHQVLPKLQILVCPLSSPQCPNIFPKSCSAHIYVANLSPTQICFAKFLRRPWTLDNQPCISEDARNCGMSLKALDLCACWHWIVCIFFQHWPNIGIQFPKHQASIFNCQILCCITVSKGKIDLIVTHCIFPKSRIW